MRRMQQTHEAHRSVCSLDAARTQFAALVSLPGIGLESWYANQPKPVGSTP